MAEITLADLLAWEPRLRAVDPGTPTASLRGAGARSGAETGLDREVAWAVAARATPPMLPPLRGGELVLLPRRILAEANVSLPVLLRELASHDAAGAVVEEGEAPGRAPLPVLAVAAEAMAPGHDLEGEMNRLLTQRRGELYRAGTDLGRVLAGLTTADAGMGQVLAATAATLGLPAAVLDARGAPLAASGAEAVPPGGGAARGTAPVDRVVVPLAGGEKLWLGPVPRDRLALARLVGERVAVAAEAALARAARARPRGPARAAALAAFLTGGEGATAGPADLGAHVAALGLTVDGAYRVALAAPEWGAAALERRLAPLGPVHDAGKVDGALAALVEVRPASPGAASRSSREPLGRGVGPSAAGTAPATDRGWLALSGVAERAADLPAAAREARYVAALLAAGALPGPTARFDALADLGAFRLLYRHWGTSELDAFAAEALGELPGRDRRGTLRKTLLAYLETGSSHVEAAARLDIHRNTLSYRLKQIATLTGRDPANPETRLLLHLALLAAALPAAPSAG